MKRNEADDAIYFSALHGGMMYRYHRMDADPFPGADWFPRKSRNRDADCPILSPALGAGKRETFFLRKIVVTGETHFLHIARKILRPPRTDGILWPVDLLILSDRQSAKCRSAVARVYTDRPPPSITLRSGPFALAFRNPRDFFPHPRDFRAENLAQAKEKKPFAPFNWKNPSVRDLAVDTLEILQALNLDGYYYNDFHLSRVFLTGDPKRPMLDYSELILSSEDAAFPLADKERCNYPPEFADPAVMRGIIPAPDADSQNYSLCAFLFYLLFGFCPYDGDSMRHLRDDTPSHHYKKFLLHYHNDIPPVFAFDPGNDRNSLGLFAKDEVYVKLWAEAPETLRRQFVGALAEENVMRRAYDGRIVKPRFPDPAAWLYCLRDIDWPE